MTRCNIAQAEIKLNIHANINRREIKEAIATKYPSVKLTEQEVEQLLRECLEGSFHDKLPEDIKWRIQNDPYFESFKEKLAEAQLDAEEEDSLRELDSNYWKDTCGSLCKRYG